MPAVQRALLSVSDKTGLLPFAKELSRLGIELLSTGGTAKLLKENNIPVIDVSDYTGFPEMLDGRVKTLHPNIHAGLLARRDNAEHMQALEKHGIGRIDLLVVNLYPFEKTVANPKASLAEAIENIDIGGPTMIRAAAKNYQDVAVLVDPADYASIAKELSDGKATLSRETCFALAQKVFAHTAAYDAAITSYLSTYKTETQRTQMPQVFASVSFQMQELRYGENPHQQAAFYRDVHTSDESSLVNAKQLHGKELSYNNILDADATLEMIKEFIDDPFAVVIVKHTNPCGAALSSASLADAFAKAQSCDPVSCFGGIVALNREVDEATAKLMAASFFEVILAPSYSATALEVLQKKKNIRLLELGALKKNAERKEYTLRKVTDGLLVQEKDAALVEIKDARCVTERRPQIKEEAALRFAWKMCKHVKSNAIVLASHDRLLGVGAGQMSRVDSVRIARMKWNDIAANLQLEEDAAYVLASDAFFPFRDGIDQAREAGATALIQPGGSMRDDEVIAAANEHQMAMLFTGERHFKH